MEVEEEETPKSPEAKLGMQVEDLWDVQEPRLSPTEKLNACFKSIPVSAFPSAPQWQIFEITSDTNLADAVKLLARHKVLSAPVVDVKASDDASWMDRYIGIVEFAAIVVWILNQSEKMEGGRLSDEMISNYENDIGTAVAAASNTLSSPRLRSMNPDSPTSTCGEFFKTLTSSDFYKNTMVGDISGSFRWAPFLAIQKSDTFLTMLLLLSKYRMKSIPVVDLGEAKINNIITQRAVIHMLKECVGLHWFESWGSKKLSELGLPLMKSSNIVQVSVDEPVLQAFKLMLQKGVGGVPVVANEGNKAVGNISIRDVQFLLMAPEIYKEYKSITAKDFLTAASRYAHENQNVAQSPVGMVTCVKDDKLKEVIMKLDATKVHRIYVVDEAGKLEGLVTLRDIISKLVHEPRGYFGDFFDGVLPQPTSSRV